MKPFREHSIVRTLTEKTDSKGRTVPKGSKGVVVHIYPDHRDSLPAYTIEVTIVDNKGVASDSHIFDALHEELKQEK